MEVGGIPDDWRAVGYYMRQWEEDMKSPQVFYVLLDASKKAHGKVAEALKEMTGVVEVHAVAGDYNIVVKVTADDVEDSCRRFCKAAKELPGVRQVKSLIPTAP